MATSRARAGHARTKRAGVASRALAALAVVATAASTLVVSQAAVPQAAQAAQKRKNPKKGAPTPAQTGSPAASRSPARSNRSRGRIPPRPDLPKSRQKDSTEQKSLMKPFYIDHD